MQSLLIAASGPDRTGLVHQLTETLGEYGANIADSRLVNLGGRFSIMMLVQAPGEQVKGLYEQLPQAASRIGLALDVHEVESVGSGERTPEPGAPYRIRTYAMDQPGIVRRISETLTRARVNIEELQTHLQHAAHSGAPLFTMDMIVTVPESCSLKDLRRQLQTLCDEMNCDLDIEPG